MPVNLVPVDAFAANFQAAADGDPVSQATEVNVMQEYADAVTYLRNRLFAGTLNVACQSPALVTGAAGLFFFEAGTSSVGQRWRTAFDTAGSIHWPVQLPPVGRITAVNVITQGNGAHAAPPATLATVNLYRVRSTAGSAVAVATVVTETDTNNAATIDTVHAWAVTAINETIDPLSYYVLVFNNESGANARPNTTIHRIGLTIALPT
jgi:hypothetical protein